MSEPSEHIRLMWESLKQVATETLDHKRRLGQYAVIWQDGKPAIVGGEMDAHRTSLPAATRPAPSSRA